MSSGVPPGLVLLLAAALLPFLPLRGRRLACLLAPLVALPLMYMLPAGKSWELHVVGLPLVLARTDALSLVFGLVFLIVAALANLYGWHRSSALEQASGLVYAGAGLFVVFSGDLLSMFVGWEVMAVASALLIFARRRPESLRAAQRYLLVHFTAGGALLLGVLLVMRASGSMAFGNLGGFGAASALLLVGLCINAAVPPLHPWLPDAYPESTVAGGVFLSAFTTKTAVYCLIRGFPGAEVLVWAGAVMAVYGVAFAVLENNIRRLLAYHIVSQVGYMVCGVGIGTEMALNGATAHAFCHIIYKGLLFMGTGAVIYSSGREKLTDLGGLARQMPWTLVMYMIGALSISGLPLFNGFVSKSMVVTAAAEAHRPGIAMLLNLASVGTFLSVGLKLPYFAWFDREPSGPAVEVPRHMLLAMGLASALCIALGVAPGWLYALLPFAATYDPFTAPHVFEMLLLPAFTALGFWWLLDRLRPHRAITLDTDWFYRAPAARFLDWVSIPLDGLSQRLGAWFGGLAATATEYSRNPPLVAWRLIRGESIYRGAAEPEEEAPGLRHVPRYDEDRQRPQVAVIVVWVLTIFAILAVSFLSRK